MTVAERWGDVLPSQGSLIDEEHDSGVGNDTHEMCAESAI